MQRTLIITMDQHWVLLTYFYKKFTIGGNVNFNKMKANKTDDIFCNGFHHAELDPGTTRATETCAEAASGTTGSSAASPDPGSGLLREGQGANQIARLGSPDGGGESAHESGHARRPVEGHSRTHPSD